MHFRLTFALHSNRRPQALKWLWNLDTNGLQTKPLNLNLLLNVKIYSQKNWSIHRALTNQWLGSVFAYASLWSVHDFEKHLALLPVVLLVIHGKWVSYWHCIGCQQLLQFAQSWSCPISPSEDLALQLFDFPTEEGWKIFECHWTNSLLFWGTKAHILRNPLYSRYAT